MSFNIDITKDRLYLKGFREGYEEGIREKKLIIAVKLLDIGTSMENAVLMTGFSREEIIAQRDNMAS